MILKGITTRRQLHICQELLLANVGYHIVNIRSKVVEEYLEVEQDM